MKQSILLLFLFAIISITPACKDKPKETSLPEINTITEEASIAGSGYLQLEIKVDDMPVKTDSAKYVVHDVDGLRIESWGERITEGPYAYTYTLEMRIHSFHGKGDHALTGEQGTMFWQYKSYYIQPANPGTFTAENWNADKINGQFQFIADDGYGNKKRVEGRFFQR